MKKSNKKTKPLFKFEKEIDTIMRQIEPRIIDVCSKFERGVYNEATMFAFWVGLGGDLDDALKKIEHRDSMRRVRSMGKNIRRRRTNLSDDKSS